MSVEHIWTIIASYLCMMCLMHTCKYWLLQVCVLVDISLLKGAEELCIRKAVKPDYGGGNKEFVYEDQHFFVGSDDPATFFTSQERQSVVRHMLFSLRAHQGDELDKIQFLEGQAVGMKARFVLMLVILCTVAVSLY